MSDVNTSQSRNLSRQKIDKEIEDAIEVVRKLKTRRNALAHISLLPTEILSKIFTTLAHSYTNRSDLSWIRSVTAVCGYWRTVAVGCPNLWSHIDCSKPVLVKKMLKRSKMAPLIIKADVDKHKMMDAIHVALQQHISRIKELRLVASRDNMEKLLAPVDKPAPLLQSLCLSVPDYELYTVQEALFVGDGHHLQSLELHNCNVPWGSPLLCGLIHFKLHETFRLDTIQLLGALDKMPLLQTLDLVCSSVPDVSSLNITRVVHLSHLTSLRLSSGIIEHSRLLEHISYPATTSLGLSLGLSCDTATGGYSTVFDALSSVWNGKDDSELLRSLFIDTRSMLDSRLQGWTTDKKADEIPSGPAQIDFHIRYIHQPGPVIEICNALTLTNLTSLFIYIYDPVAKDTWLSAFGHLTSLRTIYVRGQAVTGLVSALSIGLEDLAGNDTEEIFFPGLHTLWLGEANFVEGFNDLRDCLMSRCHWNVEVRELLLERGQLYPHQVKLLKEIVVDVNWARQKWKENESISSSTEEIGDVDSDW